jgi:type I restriction enzyme, S subunit
MNSFPETWELTTLEHYGEIVSGGTPDRNNPAYWNGDVLWVTPSEITANKGKYLQDTREKITKIGLNASSAKLLPENSLLVTSRATMGEVAVAAKPVSTNQGFKSIVPNSETDPNFAYHKIKTIKREMVRLASGTTFLEISKGDFSRIVAHRPQLPEQSRIAYVLDTIDETIARTEAVIAKLKQVRAGMLHDLLSYGLDEHGQIRDPIAHPEQFKDSPLGLIPDDWEIDYLLNRISLPEGQVDPRLAPYSEWVLIAPDHIESATGRLMERKTAKEQGVISGKYVFEPGDIVYSKIRPYLRKAVLATERGLCSADMYPLRPNEDVDSIFLLATILHEPFSRFASAVSMRSGFPKINRKELAEYSMSWPRPDEQRMISEKLNTLEAQQITEELELYKLKKISSGLQEDLLSGRVRVPEAIMEGAECE